MATVTKAIAVKLPITMKTENKHIIRTNTIIRTNNNNENWQ